jgi:uncharacterized protein (TIGR02145 family)
MKSIISKILIYFIILALVSLISCVKPNNYDKDLFESCGVLTDSRDGQQYETVKIGEKCWMADNLNVGIMIQAQFNQVNNDTIEKYCYGNSASNCETYGGLYQWEEMMNYSTQEGAEGICPVGWRLPTDEDWKDLEIALGMFPQDADKINAWRGDRVGEDLKENRRSNFNALYAGSRTSSGQFANIKGSSVESAFFYSSTLSNAEDYPITRTLRSTYSGVGRFNSYSSNYGFSVRCVQ